MTTPRQQRAIAAYLGLAVGDALGATVEFMTPNEIRAEYGVHDRICGGGWLRLKPGQVTDDTTMSLALGQAILDAGGVDAQAIARAFDAWMRAKPVDIGNTVRRGILHFRRTGQTAVPPNEHDGGNGACMRVLPVALHLPDDDEAALRTACIAQAHVTHNSEVSDAGTICVARMLQLAIGGASIGNLLQGPVKTLIDAQPAFAFRDRRREENPSGYIVHTLRAVLQALYETDGFESCLVDVVNRGGDADTTGAIAGMLAGALYGLDAIPEHWLSKLDPSIRHACEAQAMALLPTARGCRVG
ncbi:MAG: ADP-ribosyl-[dinitrogen reductase] hydrolase [Chromatiales bacterium]|jgi:ADP-ribosyl-[dinitrogen reductase] hydrolase|nr:ADP-ribosyl-[dinitrogen reductase] hydrolase [Chromatiales bacterium]MDX9765952.1 ADP-ribosyl-[dinitrogen reductase] hydrolase [Ectothiorhodospiraceae bacterium]